jgi:DNA-directed RNA polymerase specialized sigma24 family protein
VLDKLVPLVYSNLRGMAAAHLRRETGSQTIDPTALVHEAYLRLVGDTDPEFHNRSHFLGVASRVMRQILVELDDALVDLEKQDPEKSHLLELKYFGGMTAEESAELLGVPLHKVNRQIRLAQAWLRREFEAFPGSVAPDTPRGSV